MRDVVAATFPRARTRSLELLTRLSAVAPWRVLAVFVGLQWVLVLGLAFTVRHNGWIYYQGGDQLWYYTGAWLLTHGQFWDAGVGYLWTLPMAPIAAVVGPNVANAYPVVIGFQVVVLLPLVIVAVYGIGARIGGRLFGYWLLALWLLVPLVGIAYTDAGYHQRFTEVLLPQAFGLTAMADFPTMVAVVVSAYFCLRALLDDEDAGFHAVGAGLAAGAAIALKSSAALYLLGPALGFLAAQRSRAAALFTVGMAPDVIALAYQKWQGFGYIPLFHALGGERLAAGATLSPIGTVGLTKYLPFHWPFFVQQLDQLREHFWSARLIEWLVIAGAIGLLRRSPRTLAFVGGWFVGVVILKTASGRGDIEGGNLLRLLMPGYPAFIVLLGSLPFVLPRVPRRFPWPAMSPTAPNRRRRVVAIAAVVLLTAVLPIAVYAAAAPVHGPKVRAAYLQQPPIPIGVALGTTARTDANGVHLAWRGQHADGGKVFYHVFRSRPGVPTTDCPSVAASKPLTCKLSLDDLGTTRVPEFVDVRPATGHYEYFVGVAANWLNDVTQGDVYELGEPVAVHVP